MNSETALDAIRTRTNAEVYLLELIDRCRTETRLLANQGGPKISVACLPVRASCAKALRDLATVIEGAR